MANEDKARIHSALLLFPPFLAAIGFGGMIFIALAAVVLALATWEWGGIAMGRAGRTITTAIALGWGLIIILSQQFVGHYPTILCLIVFLGMWLAAVIGGKFERSKRVGSVWWMLAGAFYLSFACAAFVWLRNFGGWEITLWLILTVAATDVAAYVGGRHFGGGLLMPKISPKKTYSGLFSSLAAALTAGSVLALSLFDSLATKLLFVFLSLPVGLAANIGDGFESFFKRRFSVKDSGNLVPGHGGVLDLADSHFMAGIFLAVIMSGYG